MRLLRRSSVGDVSEGYDVFTLRPHAQISIVTRRICFHARSNVRRHYCPFLGIKSVHLTQSGIELVDGDTDELYSSKAKLFLVSLLRNEYTNGRFNIK